MTYTHDSLMPFGKHKDKKLKDVPVDYLVNYLYNIKGLEHGLRNYIDDNMSELTKKLNESKTHRTQKKTKKEIIITIHTEGRLSGMIEIESNDLGFTYSDIGLGMDGLQGMWTGGAPEYKELQKLCRQMTDTIKKINELH